MSITLSQVEIYEFMKHHADELSRQLQPQNAVPNNVIQAELSRLKFFLYGYDYDLKIKEHNNRDIRRTTVMHLNEWEILILITKTAKELEMSASGTSNERSNVKSLIKRLVELDAEYQPK
jgi:hypothetical protein